MLVGYVAAVERCIATPLYRLYSASGQNLFYTLSASPERDNAVNALGVCLRVHRGMGVDRTVGRGRSRSPRSP